MGILAKLIELKESYDLCYLWRVKNTTSKRFSFTQKHLSGFTQHRLDYTFISSTFQELANTTEIPTPSFKWLFSCALLSFKRKRLRYLRDKAFWKFNSFLTKEQNYITEIKKLIGSFCTKEKFFFNVQLKWEFIKYELRKFTVNYTKHITKEKRQQQANLENQLKMLEKSLDEDDNLFKYYAIELEWSMN